MGQPHLERRDLHGGCPVISESEAVVQDPVSVGVYHVVVLERHAGHPGGAWRGLRESGRESERQTRQYGHCREDSPVQRIWIARPEAYFNRSRGWMVRSKKW